MQLCNDVQMPSSTILQGQVWFLLSGHGKHFENHWMWTYSLFTSTSESHQCHGLFHYSLGYMLPAGVSVCKRINVVTMSVNGALVSELLGLWIDKLKEWFIESIELTNKNTGNITLVRQTHIMYVSGHFLSVVNDQKPGLFCSLWSYVEPVIISCRTWSPGVDVHLQSPFSSVP